MSSKKYVSIRVSKTCTYHYSTQQKKKQKKNKKQKKKKKKFSRVNATYNKINHDNVSEHTSDWTAKPTNTL
jgi:hypothetical protein